MKNENITLKNQMKLMLLNDSNPNSKNKHEVCFNNLVRTATFYCVLIRNYFTRKVK
jgi:hypothetical protein